MSTLDLPQQSPHLAGLSQGKTDVVIFIIGPWAGKWFASQPSAAQTAGVRWTVAPEADDFQKSLRRIRLKNHHVSVRTFFPFLPDEQQDEAHTLAQLANWQKTFNQVETFPCVLAIYARLSQRRTAGHVTHSWWSDKFRINRLAETTVENEARQLLALVKQHAAGHEHCALQRYVMTDMLVLWLKESGVMKALQSLFSSAPLRLSAVLLADYGDGFVRHGAWAHWINNKFRLYPGLSATAALPPLPTVLRGFAILNPAPLPEKSRSLHWFPVAVTLILACCLLSATWLQSQRLSETHRLLDAFTQTDAAGFLQKRNAFEKLTLQSRALSRCDNDWFIRLWQLPGCQKLLHKVNTELRKNDYAFLSVAPAAVAIFPQGSAALRADSDEILSTLLPLVENNKQMTFMVLGHSDNTGTPELNMQLSTQRATVVRDWLIRHTDVPADRFIIKGMGDTVPVSSNQTAEGRKKNRRVELIPLPEQHSNHGGKKDE